jgi:uracil-DNA glycosylase
MRTAQERREDLKAVFHEASACTRCPQLAATRTTVVFGSGNSDADLMFVGEAPGRSEDEQGLPFVGQAGRLLSELLGDIGLERSDVFVANVLKCLRYNAQVQLGDGSWERIGRLVRSRYSGTVMAVAPDGTIEPKRVTGWHATPLSDRRVFKLTYRSAKAAGAARVNVELTGDHPVLTERGYVRVDELQADDRIAVGQGLSDVAWQVSCGTLLGDGSITRGRGHLFFGHSDRQGAYASWKAGLLAELDPVEQSLRVAAVAGGPQAYDVVHVRTRAHRALRVLRRQFYGTRKQVPAWVDGGLTHLMLAVWFMDDGYTRIRGGGRQPLSEIATNGFEDDDVQVLLRALQRVGLPAKALRGRLFFDVPTSRRLSECMAPFVPPPMRYKLHPEVESAIPYESARVAIGPQRTLYDEVEVVDVTDRPRRDVTFFCIDVADHHNFVTSGGVVHNCRPPGNRDPLPQEIANCQDYLFRQLELIEPRVVCTLGNFSTKLLRGDPTGITRLHGRAEVRTIGPRTVRLYPLYHPAAALYTRSLLDTLKADFSRIPDLLALDVPPQPEPVVVEVEPAAVPEPRSAVDEPDRGEEAAPAPVPEAQLGLF